MPILQENKCWRVILFLKLSPEPLPMVFMKYSFKEKINMFWVTHMNRYDKFLDVLYT